MALTAMFTFKDKKCGFVKAYARCYFNINTFTAMEEALHKRLQRFLYLCIIAFGCWLVYTIVCIVQFYIAADVDKR